MRKLNIYEAVRYGLSGDRILELASDKLLDTSDAEILFDNDEWLVVLPHTYEGIQVYGGDTLWDLASEDAREHFDTYLDDGPFVIFIDKITNEKYLSHSDSNLLLNRENTEVDPESIEGFPSFVFEDVLGPIALEEGLGNIMYRAGQGISNLARGARNIAVGFGAEARGISNKTIDELLNKLGYTAPAAAASTPTTPRAIRMINYLASIIKAGKLSDYKAITTYRELISKYYTKGALLDISQWDPRDFARLVDIYTAAGGV